MGLLFHNYRISLLLKENNFLDKITGHVAKCPFLTALLVKSIFGPPAEDDLILTLIKKQAFDETDLKTVDLVAITCISRRRTH